MLTPENTDFLCLAHTHSINRQTSVYSHSTEEATSPAQAWLALTDAPCWSQSDMTLENKRPTHLPPLNTNICSVVCLDMFPMFAGLSFHCFTLNKRTRSLTLSVPSYPAVCEFLQTNNLLSIIRAHEAQDAG